MSDIRHRLVTTDVTRTETNECVQQGHLSPNRLVAALGQGGGQLPSPRWMLCPPQTSHLQFFLHIKFPSPVSLDAQM